MLDYDQFKTANGELNLVPGQDGDLYPRGANLPSVEIRAILTGDFTQASGPTNENLFTILFYALPIPYGCVHLAAWEFEFPTAIESLLWKISGFIIVSLFSASVSILLLIIILATCVLANYDADKISDRFSKQLGKFMMLVFMLSRLYIVVEAFVSLRAVPIGVYWTPAWVQMIPHV